MWSHRSPAGFRRGVGAVVIAAALTATACADGGEPGATRSDPATPTDETVAWADSACSALVPVVESVQAPPFMPVGYPGPAPSAAGHVATT